MEAELGAHRPQHGQQFPLEDGIVEGLDHVPLGELPQIAAALGGGAGGEALGHLAEVGTLGEFFLDLETLFLGLDQDVLGTGFFHRNAPRRG